MARTPAPERKSAALTPVQMQVALPKLDRRLADLESFDITTIQERFDPAADALATKVNGTLQEVLGHDTVEYNEYSVGSFDTLPLYMGGERKPLPEVRNGYKEGLRRCSLKLKTLRDLFAERIADSAQQPATTDKSSSRPVAAGNKVFVVHGHDVATKESVARFLSMLQLEPVILHEQPNHGRTIIEKFEAYAGVAFAVVLLTPDDIGHPKSSPDSKKDRARQNVVFELGFFTGALGREHVCALFSPGVEMPSDYSGVLYHELDPAGAWRFLLARELKAAGLKVDLNDVA